jgi:hypothetical protein
MKSFLTIGSVVSNNKSYLNNELLEEAVDDHHTASSVNESDKSTSDQNLNKSDLDSPSDSTENPLNKHYLFNGKYYEIISINENKSTAKCQLCLKILQRQIGSTEHFLSHIKVCTNYNMFENNNKKYKSLQKFKVTIQLT